MDTRSELPRENKELTDRKELLELRQHNRKLQRQIKRLESGKSEKELSHSITIFVGNATVILGVLFIVFFVALRIVEAIYA